VKYNLVVENTIKNLSSLKKIRIKADPRFILNAQNDLSNCPSYEGYVLEEGLSKVKVLILPPDLSIHEIPTELIEYISAENKAGVFDDLKVFIIKKLDFKEDNPAIHQIANSQCINDVETFLKQQNVNEDQILELYKEFILT